MRLSGAIEVSKFTLDAHGAFGIARDTNGLEMAGPHIARDEARVQVGIAAGEELDGFGGLERGDEIDDRAQHTNRVASFLETLAATSGREQAREAWRQTRANGHREPVAGDGGGVNPS